MYKYIKIVLSLLKKIKVMKNLRVGVHNQIKENRQSLSLFIGKLSIEDLKKYNSMLLLNSGVHTQINITVGYISTFYQVIKNEANISTANN